MQLLYVQRSFTQLLSSVIGFQSHCTIYNLVIKTLRYVTFTSYIIMLSGSLWLAQICHNAEYSSTFSSGN